MSGRSRPSILVDLDGTLAHYDGWKGPTHIGAPIPKMVARVKAWLAKNECDVKIFTARVSGPDAHLAEVAILAWCEEHLGRALDVTCTKDFTVVQIWDDRAIRVVQNAGHPCCTNGMAFGPPAVDPEEA